MKKIIKKHFKSEPIMTKQKKMKINFQVTDKCQICNKLFDKIDVRIRDHCHITGKFRSSTNFWLKKRMFITCHNLRGKTDHNSRICQVRWKK